MLILSFGDPRWPLTSCAHRLRKPHRSDEPLTLAVTRWLDGSGIHPSPRETLCDPTPKRLPAGSYHRIRPADRAACLRRRNQANRSAFVRIDPDLAAQEGSIALVDLGLALISLDTRSRATSRADPVKGWLVASRYSRAPRPRLSARPTRSRKDASLRLLQPTSFTSTPPDPSIPELASHAPLRVRFVTTPAIRRR